jgi:rhodanese-related sulfurtransferase
MSVATPTAVPARPLLRLVPVLVAAGLALALVGCSSSEPTARAEPDEAGQVEAPAGPSAGAESAAVALEEGRVVIDVRTPEEFAAGHVAGATLIDVQDPGFAAAIAELDPAGDYVVYCRSGNRSAVAADEMRAAGLDVLDGGGFETMTAAGWPTA